MTILQLVTVAAVGAGCGNNGGGPDVADAPCTFASCERECRALGLSYGSCAGGSCRCSGADADVFEEDAAVDDGWAEDAGAADGDAADGEAADAETIEEIVLRDGGSPGVVCRKVPSPSRVLDFWGAHGERSLVGFAGFIREDRGYFAPLFLFDGSSHALRVLDDLSDVVSAPGMAFGTWEPAVQHPFVAYGVWFQPADQVTAQLRLADLASGEKRVLAEDTCPNSRPCTIGRIRLHDPWVLWRQVSASTFYGWYAYALNLESGRRVDDLPHSVVDLDLWEATAVVSGEGGIWTINLDSDDRTVVSPVGGEVWAGTITPDWVAWLDQRAYPEGHWFSPYGTQIYGRDRHTGEEVPLVTSPGMHGRELDGEGDWLVYTDQRDNPEDPWREDRRRLYQNVYALHLPTRTEICVVDWPGHQMSVRAYTAIGETRVLLFDELSYAEAEYDLWDCNLTLPE
jgi:hypothetical protein